MENQHIQMDNLQDVSLSIKSKRPLPKPVKDNIGHGSDCAPQCVCFAMIMVVSGLIILSTYGVHYERDKSRSKNVVPSTAFVNGTSFSTSCYSRGREYICWKSYWELSEHHIPADVLYFKLAYKGNSASKAEAALTKHKVGQWYEVWFDNKTDSIWWKYEFSYAIKPLVEFIIGGSLVFVGIFITICIYFITICCYKVNN